MNWEQFVEMAKADGWKRNSYGGKGCDYVSRTTRRGLEILVFPNCMCIGNTGMEPVSLELALAAANAVAEAVGGWRA